MALFTKSGEKPSFSARKVARQVILRGLREFDPEDDWIAEEIEIGRLDATPDRVDKARSLLDEERKKLIGRLEEKWA